ncbi:MAG: enoyl-CoA hydratase/isomerase family protein [Proteobacteria bacterium]|nr:enoyl-CoA hydratase/isomerase family protein [Pseudomonadota bacterium]
MSNHLQLTREGPLAILTLCRGERRNALNGPLWTALKEAAFQLADDLPGVLIITGSDGHFCSGMDLSGDNPIIQRLVPALHAKDATSISELLVELKSVFSSYSRLRCPVIAAIEGACVGGGMELALACDLRVATTDAIFSLPETRWGMIPDVGGTVRLVRLIGRSRATDIILSGRRLSAQEAFSNGIVNRLTTPGTALDSARELAKSILRCGPQATLQALLALRQVPFLSDDEAFSLETDAGTRAICSGEVAEGIQAFLEKRQPNWD